MKGILIIGHGSKIEEGNIAFEKLVKEFSVRSSLPVYGAHMALAKPSIDESVHKMIADGIRDIVVLPYLLYGGKHIKKHIPEKLASLKEEIIDVKFTLTSTLANDPLVIQAMYNRVEKYM